MLKIKLAPVGKKKAQSYRIVIQNNRNKRNGTIVEKIGTYNPLPVPTVKLERKRLDYWLKIGAKPTKTVNSILNSKQAKSSTNKNE